MHGYDLSSQKRLWDIMVFLSAFLLCFFRSSSCHVLPCRMSVYIYIYICITLEIFQAIIFQQRGCYYESRVGIKVILKLLYSSIKYLRTKSLICHTAGISLTAEQWASFSKNVPAIEKAIRKMESRLN